MAKPSLHALGPTSLGAVLYRHKGWLRVAVIAKATFRVEHGGVMAPEPAQPITERDRFYDESPLRGVQHPSDKAPLKPHVDVTLTGTAHTPGGAALPAMSARLGVFRGQEVLLDKTLAILGERQGPTSAPKPFARLPLRTDAGGAPPQVVDPKDPSKPASFGPISTYLPARRALLKGLSADKFKADVLDLPDDFAWEYFQHAPSDQRVARLTGDEWIVIDGLSAASPRVQTRLPGARALGKAHLMIRGEIKSMDVDLALDTVHLDMDHERCSLTYRGRFALAAGEAAIPSLRVVAGVEVPGAPLVWPEGASLFAPQTLSPALGSTVGITDAQQRVLAERPSTPFQRPSAPPPSMPLPPSQDLPLMTVAMSDRAVAEAAMKEIAPYPVAPPNEAGSEKANIPGAPWFDIASFPAPLEPPPEEPLPAPAPPPPPSGAGEGAPPPPKSLRPKRRSSGVPRWVKGPFSVATIPWQLRPPKDSITVVVKGTFSIVPGGAAKPKEEPDPPAGDVHANDDPDDTLLVASDFAVLKPKADVTLRGSAKPKTEAKTARVRFSFGAGKQGFDKAIAVVGSRVWQKVLMGLVPSEPLPFSTMPLTYDRARGGKGQTGEAGAPLPNLEDPAHLITSPSDSPAPVGFGPLSPRSPERMKGLGTYDARWLRARWPYYPEDFDPTCLQAAPPDQQTPYLKGDEPFTIFGVHREHDPLTGTLPKLAPRCVVKRVEAEGGGAVELPLHLDTVALDTDAMTLHLVWRGAMEVKGDEAPEIEGIFVAPEAIDAGAAKMSPDEVIARAKPLPIVEPPEPEPPAANEVSEPSEAQKDLDKKLAEAQAQLHKAMAEIGVDPNKPAPTPTPPPPQDPAVMAKALSDAGLSEEEVKNLLDVLKSVEDHKNAPPKEPAPEPPKGARARVLDAIAAGKKLDGMDLAGADLEEMDLSGQSMVGAKLAKAKLMRCNLTGVDLSGADLHEADLSFAVLKESTLTRAALTKVVGREADLRGAKGVSADLSDGDFSRARFDDAHLPGLDLSRTTLGGAQFTAAKLPKVRLFDAHGQNVRFDGADLTEARADDVSLVQSSFREVSAQGSTWEGADLTEAIFFGARLDGANVSRAAAKGAVFSGARAREARFSRSMLQGASFLKADLMKATFEQADLSGADLRGASLYGAELWKARLNGAKTDLADVTKTKLAGRG